MWLHAPFDPAQVDLINRLQAGVVPAPVHPLTCPNARNGQHAFAGGYLGTLVAQRRGLVCPTCGHTQTWIPRSMLACAERAADPAIGHPSQRIERARQRALDDFAALVRAGSLAAQPMVDTLAAMGHERRATSAAAEVPPGAANAAVVSEPLAA